MPDFSYITTITADEVGSKFADHRPITDEQLLEALGKIEPPLLPPELMEVVFRELELGHQRRGRPKKSAPTRLTVAEYLSTIDRLDVPALFAEALAERLKTGKRYTEFDRSVPAHRRSERVLRNMAIRRLVPQFRDLIGDEPTIEHPIVGTHAVPPDGARTDKAIAMTSDLLREAGFDPPSPGAIRNICSKNSTPKL